MEEKAYNIAHSYYKTGKYNASIYSFNNFIESYPNSSFRKSFYYQTKSFFELAKNSVEEKKGITDKRVYICIPRFYLNISGKFITELKNLRDEVIKKLTLVKQLFLEILHELSKGNLIISIKPFQFCQKELAKLVLK